MAVTKEKRGRAGIPGSGTAGIWEFGRKWLDEKNGESVFDPPPSVLKRLASRRNTSVGRYLLTYFWYLYDVVKSQAELAWVPW